MRDLTLYHAVPHEMRGEILNPLNVLRATHPDLHARAAAKYAGRETLMREHVAPLGVTWADCLFLSPVHPGPLLDAAREAGWKVPLLPYYAVPADALDPARTCLKRVRPWKDGRYRAPNAEDYLPYTPETLRTSSSPPSETLHRLRSTPPVKGARLILWMDVPHVLYAGTLNIRNLPQVPC